MKYLRVNFCHPVKVRANFIRLSPKTSLSTSLIIDSNENVIEIPTDKLGKGLWRVVLDWEHDGQTFIHQKDFKISN